MAYAGLVNLHKEQSVSDIQLPQWTSIAMWVDKKEDTFCNIHLFKNRYDDFYRYVLNETFCDINGIITKQESWKW